MYRHTHTYVYVYVSSISNLLSMKIYNIKLNTRQSYINDEF